MNTFMAARVVSVMFRGPADGSLVRKFLTWCTNERVKSRMAGGFTGRGSHQGLYSPEDAKRIIAWLKEQGVTPVEGSEDI